MSDALFGGVEAGGTKFVCGIGTLSSSDIRRQRIIPTTTPEETIRRVADFFRSGEDVLSGIGVGTFGPVQLNPASPHYGHITSTAKLAWRNFDIRGAILHALGLPIAIDTDVNAAALAEARWGAAKDVGSCLYVTIGTGVGGGAIIDGKVLLGLTHPEMGHIRIPHDMSRDPFPGCCPYHGDCLEGLVSGPALHGRWGVSGEALPDEHPAWRLQAEYLALACMNWICTLSPERIILGGGTVRPHLFPLIRRRASELLNGYIDEAAITQHLDEYIVPSPLGGKAGLLGALALAAQVHLQSKA